MNRPGVHGDAGLAPAVGLIRIESRSWVAEVAFGLLGFAALRICGTRVFWVSAVLGHIGSTIAVYAIIGASRLTDPDVFVSAFARRDFGARLCKEPGLAASPRPRGVGLESTSAHGPWSLRVCAESLVSPGGFTPTRPS
jgi:hypothetical protein